MHVNSSAVMPMTLKKLDFSGLSQS